VMARPRRVDYGRIAALHAEGISAEQIASAVGCSRTLAYRVIQEADMASKRKVEAPRTGRQFGQIRTDRNGFTPGSLRECCRHSPGGSRKVRQEWVKAQARAMETGENAA
jgi:hypothetical protein